jgi:iron complex outermembrane receptor protein
MISRTLKITVSAFAVAVAVPAAAQTAEPGDAAGEAVDSIATDSADSAASDGEAIVVTGSRIARRDYVSPSPIATTSGDDMRATGAVNVEASLNQLPQFSPGQGAADGTTLGGGGRATLNLRGLGEQRNLLLLEGRRLPVSNARGVVDVNIIPSAVLQGVEVISGGASAVYGSDAISGVANFKIAKVDGLIVDAQYGNAFDGDAFSYRASVTGGGEFADGRGEMLFSVEMARREELVGAQRSFFRRAFGGSSSTGMGVAQFLAGNAPSQATIDAVFARYGIAPGTVTPTSGIGFNEDGTIFAANGGANFRPANSEYVLLNGVLSQTVAPHNTIVVPQKRYNMFGRVSYELAPEITLYTQALYSRTEQSLAQGYPLTVPVRPSVSADNPFIPSDLQQLLAGRPDANAPFIINRRFVETGRRIYDEPFDSYQILAGARGELGWRGWTWDVYASHDSTSNAETLTNAVSVTRVRTLLDAADGGASICAGGYNPFGLSNALSISQECLDYISLEAHNNTRVSQTIVEGFLQGGLFDLPAGEVRASVTMSYRRNSYDYSPDMLQVGTPSLPFSDTFSTIPTAATSGKTDVKEIAGELLIPVLADTPFAKELNLSVGYRYSDYRYSGGVSTYKVEADWRIAEPILLRGSYEHAIRAPNIEELFLAPSGAIATIGFAPTAGDPCDFRFTPRGGANGADIRTLCLAQGVPGALIDSFTYGNGQVIGTIEGNRGLSPEVADTFTVGAVLTPRIASPLFSSLTLAVDYYDIDISKVIAPIPGLSAVNKCFNLDGSNPDYSPDNFFCSLMGRNAQTGEINVLRTPFQNLGGYRTSGIDVQLDWRIDLDGLGLVPGSLHINSDVNYLKDFKIQTLPDTPFQQFAGTIGTPPLPRWKATTSLTYQGKGFDIGVRWRFTDAMRDATSVTQPQSPLPGVGAYSLFDLFGRWEASHAIELRAGITNIADREPEVVRGRLGETNGGLYDVIGRAFYAGARLRF